MSGVVRGRYGKVVVLIDGGGFRFYGEELIASALEEARTQGYSYSQFEGCIYRLIEEDFRRIWERRLEVVVMDYPSRGETRTLTASFEVFDALREVYDFDVIYRDVIEEV